MFTQHLIQVATDINTLLNTTTDYLRFVTEFFKVINKSGTHIYHSALQLAPQSSIIWKLYHQQIYSPVSKVVTGIPTTWDFCSASADCPRKVTALVWSPCGQFIAITFGHSLQVWDSNTLEKVSILEPPSDLSITFPAYPTFSSDGHLLACLYGW